MKYLSISKTPFYIAYAVFDGKDLIAHGRQLLSETNENKRLLEWERQVEQLIDEHKPTFMLTHLLNKLRLKKADIERIVEVRTILKLLAEKKKVIYAEFKTSGWEKRITDRKPTNRRKIMLVNNGYGLELMNINVADAIILGEGVAWGRLHIGDE